MRVCVCVHKRKTFRRDNLRFVYAVLRSVCFPWLFYSLVSWLHTCVYIQFLLLLLCLVDLIIEANVDFNMPMFGIAIFIPNKINLLCLFCSPRLRCIYIRSFFFFLLFSYVHRGDTPDLYDPTRIAHANLALGVVYQHTDRILSAFLLRNTSTFALSSTSSTLILLSQRTLRLPFIYFVTRRALTSFFYAVFYNRRVVKGDDSYTLRCIFFSVVRWPENWWPFIMPH